MDDQGLQKAARLLMTAMSTEAAAKEAKRARLLSALINISSGLPSGSTGPIAAPGESAEIKPMKGGA